MRTLIATLALAALTTFGSVQSADAYTGKECNEYWTASRNACREACDAIQLPRGVSRGRCRGACNRARGQFVKTCKRYSQLLIP